MGTKDEYLKLKLSDLDPKTVRLMFFHGPQGVASVYEEGRGWHKTSIKVPEIASSREFLLAYSSNKQHSWYPWSKLSEDLKTDINFANQVIEIDYEKMVYFSRKIRTNKDFIIKCISESYRQYGHMFMNRLLADNRFQTVYDICQIYPEYEKRIGAELKRRIGDMELTKFYELNVLRKSLVKNLDEKPAIKKRKI